MWVYGGVRVEGGCMFVHGGKWDSGAVLSLWGHGVWVYVGLIGVYGVL
jgi:hypothetical protein